MVSEAQKRASKKYNDKTYTLLAVHLPKDLVSDFRSKCIELNISQAEVIKEFLNTFLKQ